jgi:hypothetical protein
MTVRHSHTNPQRHRTTMRTGRVGSQARAAPELKPGQVRCPVCRNGVRLTANGYLRKHADLFGHPCFNKAL